MTLWHGAPLSRSALVIYYDSSRRNLRSPRMVLIPGRILDSQCSTAESNPDQILRLVCVLQKLVSELEFPHINIVLELLWKLHFQGRSKTMIPPSSHGPASPIGIFFKEVHAESSDASSPARLRKGPSYGAALLSTPLMLCLLTKPFFV